MKHGIVNNIMKMKNNFDERFLMKLQLKSPKADTETVEAS